MCYRLLPLKQGDYGFQTCSFRLENTGLFHTSFHFASRLTELELLVLMETGRFETWPGPKLQTKVDLHIKPLPDLRLELKLKTIRICYE